MNTEKQTIYNEIGTIEIEDDQENNLNTLSNWLLLMQSKDATILNFEQNDDGLVSFEAGNYVIETNEQYNKRINIQNEASVTYKRHNENRERAEYEKLKKKYGNN